MPFVPRLFVKTGIVYLGFTFLLGAVLLSLEAVGRPSTFVIGIEHGHMGFVGWLVNTVIGVALWLLPLNRKAFPATQGRYPQTVAVVAFFLLNVGLVLRLTVEPVYFAHPSALPSAALITSGISQLSGVATVAWIAWHRVLAPPLRKRMTD